MNDEQRREAAGRLLAAYEERQPVPPLTDTYPGLTIDDAYAIQTAQVARWEADGRLVKGHKVGLTSAAMQQQLGVHEPDFGVLCADTFYDEASPVPVEAFLQPRIEPEIAFVLKRDIAGPGVNVAEAIAAVDFILPSLEIIDSRITDWRITLADTVADNASSGGVALGARPTSLQAVDLSTIGGALRRNGQLVATGSGASVLGSPIFALVWLANTLGRRGVVLRAGQVVLPGSITAAATVRPGDTWSADFGVLGVVTIQFEDEADV